MHIIIWDCNKFYLSLFSEYIFNNIDKMHYHPVLKLISLVNNLTNDNAEKLSLLLGIILIITLYVEIIGKMTIILQEHSQHCFCLEMADSWQNIRWLYHCKFGLSKLENLIIISEYGSCV